MISSYSNCLQSLPKKRTKNILVRSVLSLRTNESSKPCHLTAFRGYKADMTHIVREVDRPGALMHEREVVDAVSIVEIPPMQIRKCENSFRGYPNRLIAIALFSSSDSIIVLIPALLLFETYFD